MLWIRRHTHPLSLLTSHTRRWQQVFLLAGAVGAAVYAGSARGDWVYGTGYLWNMSAPFSLSVVSHADATWTQRLSKSAADWSTSGVVTVKVASSGKIDLYDGYYGNSAPCAWTQYWQHGGHISHDAIYLNETCLAGWSDYWKQYAICQELGHALGLPDHNTTPTVPSCEAPGLPAVTPSTDDFAELSLLYGVSTTTSSPSGKGGGKGSTPLSGGMSSTTTTADTTTTSATTTSPGNANGGGGSPGTDHGNSGDRKPPHP